MQRGKGFGPRGCGLLGSALTGEQPDAKNIQTNVNENEFSPSILREKKKGK